MRSATTRTWVKLYVKGWLHGSIRYELTPAERSVWADLIALAGECGQNGSISDNDGKPYPAAFIARQLNINISLLTSTLKKCRDNGRIQEPNGVIFLTNWAVYQSEYERQKKYRGKDRDPDPDKFVKGRYGHSVKR